MREFFKLAAFWLDSRWRLIHYGYDRGNMEGAMLGMNDAASELKLIIEEEKHGI